MPRFGADEFGALRLGLGRDGSGFRVWGLCLGCCSRESSDVASGLRGLGYTEAS